MHTQRSVSNVFATVSNVFATPQKLKMKPNAHVRIIPWLRYKTIMQSESEFHSKGKEKEKSQQMVLGSVVVTAWLSANAFRLDTGVQWHDMLTILPSKRFSVCTLYTIKLFIDPIQPSVSIDRGIQCCKKEKEMNFINVYYYCYYWWCCYLHCAEVFRFDSIRMQYFEIISILMFVCFELDACDAEIVQFLSSVIYVIIN